MALPIMTPAQREAALAKASQSRTERAAMLVAIRSQELSLAEVLARPDDIAKRTRVAQLLRALPGHGPAAVAATMERCGIDDKRRVGGLSARQRHSLLGAAG